MKMSEEMEQIKALKIWKHWYRISDDIYKFVLNDDFHFFFFIGNNKCNGHWYQTYHKHIHYKGLITKECFSCTFQNVFDHSNTDLKAEMLYNLDLLSLDSPGFEFYIYSQE